MCESDAEQWQRVAAIFKDRPEAAYRFARGVSYVQLGLGEREAAQLDGLIIALFPHTDFYQACYYLYRMAVAGRLSMKDDPVGICKAIDPNWKDSC